MEDDIVPSMDVRRGVLPLKRRAWARPDGLELRRLLEPRPTLKKGGR
jgi:hypothetical protein